MVPQPQPHGDEEPWPFSPILRQQQLELMEYIFQIPDIGYVSESSSQLDPSEGSQRRAARSPSETSTADTETWQGNEVYEPPMTPPGMWDIDGLSTATDESDLDFNAMETSQAALVEESQEASQDAVPYSLILSRSAEERALGQASVKYSFGMLARSHVGLPCTARAA